MRLNLRIILTSTIFILFLGSCHKKAVRKEELIKFLRNEENGLTKIQSSDVFVYKVSFKPNDLVLLREITSTPGCNRELLKKELANKIYFVLNLSKNNRDILGIKDSQFSSSLNQLTSGLENRITLKVKRGSFKRQLTSAILNRTYGMSDETSLLLCFDDVYLNKLEDFSLIVTDFLNQSNDELEFDFCKKDINNIPPLKL